MCGSMNIPNFYDFSDNVDIFVSIGEYEYSIYPIFGDDIIHFDMEYSSDVTEHSHNTTHSHYADGVSCYTWDGVYPYIADGQDNSVTVLIPTSGWWFLC